MLAFRKSLRFLLAFTAIDTIFFLSVASAGVGVTGADWNYWNQNQKPDHHHYENGNEIVSGITQVVQEYSNSVKSFSNSMEKAEEKKEAEKSLKFEPTLTISHNFPMLHGILSSTKFSYPFKVPVDKWTWDKLFKYITKHIYPGPGFQLMDRRRGQDRQ